MDAWEDHIEYCEEVGRVESLNQDQTDNNAYALVYQVPFSMDEDSDGQSVGWCLDGDIIKRSDWDNNGLVGCFEYYPGTLIKLFIRHKKRLSTFGPLTERPGYF